MDRGWGNTDDGTPIANEVFDMCLVCVNALWKVRLGYFCNKGITGNQIYSLTFALSIRCKHRVPLITCDGTPSHLSSYERFRCNLKELN